MCFPVLEELLLHCLCKFGHQRRRKWMLALVWWLDWYQRLHSQWARVLCKDGCIRIRYELLFFLAWETSIWYKFHGIFIQRFLISCSLCILASSFIPWFCDLKLSQLLLMWKFWDQLPSTLFDGIVYLFSVD